jgi:hypothetical protein
MSNLAEGRALLFLIFIANLPFSLLILRKQFDSWADLWEAYQFWRGGLGNVDREWSKQGPDASKLWFWNALLAAAAFCEYLLVAYLFPDSISWAHRLLSIGSHS